jgi:ComF family protein
LQEFLHTPLASVGIAEIPAGIYYKGSVRTSISSLLLAFLYPQRCLGCRTLLSARTEEGFCPPCTQLLTPVRPPFCPHCGVPFFTPAGADHLCSRCVANPPSFRRARAWLCYQGRDASPQPLNTAIQHFKYHRDLSTGKALAALGVKHFPFGEERYDMVVPVPLHLQRLRWRGFNQSLVLAQAIGHRYSTTVDPYVLERTRSTSPQTHLTEHERRANVRGAFTATAPERLAGKQVLLVDDVYTSGATVEECTRALLDGGAKIVDVFTLAHAVPV